MVAQRQFHSIETSTAMAHSREFQAWLSQFSVSKASFYNWELQDIIDNKPLYPPTKSIKIILNVKNSHFLSHHSSETRCRPNSQPRSK